MIPMIPLVGELDAALQVVNEKVAACFTATPLAIKFHFVNHIRTRETKDAWRVKEVVGLCDREHRIITLKIYPDWKLTAVHELVHFYWPEGTEKQVEAKVPAVVAYLKSFKEPWQNVD
jgi:hypothetical protein